MAAVCVEQLFAFALPLSLSLFHDIKARSLEARMALSRFGV